MSPACFPPLPSAAHSRHFLQASLTRSLAGLHEGPPGESIEAKQRRVLLNRSMITTTPLNLSLGFQRR